MSQTIQLKKGIDAVRKTLIFDQGEPVWSTDTKTLHIGDGITSGGLSVFEGINNSFISIVPTSGSTSRENASGLYLAIQDAKNKKPYNHELGPFNRFSILLYPGVYSFSSHFIGYAVIGQSSYVDIVGVGHRRDIIISHTSTINIFSGNSTFKNLSFSGGVNGGVNVANLDAGSEIKNIVIDNCDFSLNLAYSLRNSNNIITNATITDSSFRHGFLFQQLYPIINSLIKNCVVSGYDILHCPDAATTSPSGNFFLDCTFIDEPGGNYNILYSNFAYCYDKSNLFKNCYFKGNDIMLNDLSTYTPTEARFQNCRFDGNIGGGALYGYGGSTFQGVMENCIINSSDYPTRVPIVLSLESNVFPAFYNCTVIAGTGVSLCVTGDPDHASGLFIHSRFNKSIATGATGLFGNKFNIINSKIK